jgi:hypothetical protein
LLISGLSHVGNISNFSALYPITSKFSMPLCYFDFRDANGLTRDDEGYDSPDLAAMQWEAVLSLESGALLPSRANGYLI